MVRWYQCTHYSIWSTIGRYFSSLEPRSPKQWRSVQSALTLTEWLNDGVADDAFAMLLLLWLHAAALWRHTVWIRVEWIMNIHYKIWIAQGRFTNVILTPSKQWAVCDNFDNRFCLVWQLVLHHQAVNFTESYQNCHIIRVLYVSTFCDGTKILT